ncbi:RfaL Lipid A core - O-antigen ligase and related enzymes [Candidatus Methylopumilus planktonicus]|uniref:O-antigen ligase family protein n=1 Tax=Candidatus Methylopumilus planktonicus TaxID=1581557 RepID=UPI003BEEE061
MIAKLKTLDLFMLSLMIVSLPSLEAPKNFFLVGYLLTRTFFEFVEWKQRKIKWAHWDSLFLTFVLTAFLSTIFAGMPHLEEWKGYMVLLTAILTGWLLSRAQYSRENYQGLFKIIVLSALAPLLVGLYQYLIIHTKPNLQLHSVGHVNHSAIYLVMIFGASLGWFISHFSLDKFKLKLSKLYLIALGILSLIFFVSLIIGQSRAAYSAGIILGLLIINFVAKSKRIKLIGSISIMLLVLLSITLKTGVIEKQISNQEANNVLSSRDKVWNVSLEASRFSPLLGIGLSNWHFITLDQMKKSVEGRGKIFNANNYYFPGHSHNYYLSALVERGILGFLVTLTFMLLWFKHIIKTFNWATKTKESIRLWSGSLSAWIATFVIGFVNTTFHHEHAILACLFLGLYLSYTRQYLAKNIAKPI